MWSGLCAGGSLCQRRCRRTEFLPCDPGTLLFWGSGGQGFRCSQHCDRNHNGTGSRTNSRTCYSIPDRSQHPPSCRSLI
uniref:Uncharacterized protein n=1 Tax=Anguilla anguilla TaxID=7936 RepID=A0A0E9VDZ0_ANGAN